MVLLVLLLGFAGFVLLKRGLRNVHEFFREPGAKKDRRKLSPADEGRRAT